MAGGNGNSGLANTGFWNSGSVFNTASGGSALNGYSSGFSNTGVPRTGYLS
ncbi:hypothetical protein [Mycobacterium sp. Z3061]|uniref:hypothetical protein n=1 Tax=Mycobacterium sp. Z3061 TaxID=3073562 RepID=UPI0037CABDA4